MFEVNVEYIKYPERAEHLFSHRTFYGSFSAVYMAKKFASCDDVIAVDVINAETGELLYYRSSTGESYEAEDY